MKKTVAAAWEIRLTRRRMRSEIGEIGKERRRAVLCEIWRHTDYVLGVQVVLAETVRLGGRGSKTSGLSLTSCLSA